MRVGPLRFLALTATAMTVWVASRVPVILSGAARDVAAGKGAGVVTDKFGALAAASRAAAAFPPIVNPAQAGIHHGLPLARGERAVVQMAVAARIARPVMGPGMRRDDGGGAAVAARAARPMMSPGLRRDDGRAEAAIATAAVAPLAVAVEASADIPPPVSMPSTVATAPTAFNLATVAYAASLRGDRRGAARDFAAALAADTQAANAPQWRAALRTLTRRWSGEAYVLVRDGGDPGLGVAPLLGGGQSGAALAWTLDPLAFRPLAVVARATVAHLGGGGAFDGNTAQAALGVRWQVLPQGSLTIERLIAIGAGARDAWTLRAAGGVARRAGPLLADAYAEAGVVGARQRDVFASLQARAVAPIKLSGIALEPGVGLWSSIQRASTTVDRVDLGPTLTARAGPVAATLDYRVRVAGNAAPDTGPALTLSARF